MRKLVSIFMAAFILLAMPLNTLAVEDASIYTHDELIEMACSAFPEYSTSIINESTATYNLSRSVNDAEIVFSETRVVSDTETLGITLLSNGTFVIVGSSTSGFVVSQDGESYTTVGQDIIGYGSYSVTSTAYKTVFHCKNVGFIVHQDDSIYLTSSGTVSGTHKNALLKNFSSTNIHYSIGMNPSGEGQVEFEINTGNRTIIASTWN